MGVRLFRLFEGKLIPALKCLSNMFAVTNMLPGTNHLSAVTNMPAVTNRSAVIDMFAVTYMQATISRPRAPDACSRCRVLRMNAEARFVRLKVEVAVAVAFMCVRARARARRCVCACVHACNWLPATAPPATAAAVIAAVCMQALMGDARRGLLLRLFMHAYTSMHACAEADAVTATARPYLRASTHRGWSGREGRAAHLQCIVDSPNCESSPYQC